MDFEGFKRRSWRCFLMLFCVGMMLQVTGLPMAFAEEISQDDEWTFAAAPYMWFVSLDGDVTVKGQKSDIDMDFSDILDEMNIGAMIAFEASNSRWGVLADVLYANLGNDSTVDGIKIEPSFDLYVVSVGGFYRFGTWGLGEDSAATVSVDGIAGGRYTYLDLELDFKGIGKTSGHEDWLDPIVGARALFDFSEHWTLGLEGSVGGFGVGSDFSWHAAGLVGYRFDLFGDKDAKLIGGYRALSWDYDDGSGSNKFEWDVTLHGPILGLIVTF